MRSTTTQKALVLTSKQGPFTVQSINIPHPGPGDILVKIRAVALNPIDWKIPKGYWSPGEFPAIIGGDVAGDVVEVGEGVSRFSQGDRVFYQSIYTNQTAGFQQYALAHVNSTAKIPAKFCYEDAATIPVGIGTAYLGLYNNRPHGMGLEPPIDASARGKYSGTPFVLLGGATSVGQYVIQLAKASGFSPLIVTASLKNGDYLKSLGATHIIDRHIPLSSLASEVSKITNEPIKFVYDAVSSQHTQQAGYDLLAPEGTLAIVWPFIGEKNVEEKALVEIMGMATNPINMNAYKTLFGNATKLLEDEIIKPNRVEVLPNGLHGIIEGLHRIETNQVSGIKLVVCPQETL